MLWVACVSLGRGSKAASRDYKFSFPPDPHLPLKSRLLLSRLTVEIFHLFTSSSQTALLPRSPRACESISAKRARGGLAEFSPRVEPVYIPHTGTARHSPFSLPLHSPHHRDGDLSHPHAAATQCLLTRWPEWVFLCCGTLHISQTLSITTEGLWTEDKRGMLPILVFALRGLGTCRASPDDLADKQERVGEGESESQGESRLASLTSPLSCYSYLPSSCRRTQTRRRTPLLVPLPCPPLPLLLLRLIKFIPCTFFCVTHRDLG